MIGASWKLWLSHSVDLVHGFQALVPVDSQNKREQSDDNAAKDVFQTFQMKVLE